jgi:hypothetical protein
VVIVSYEDEQKNMRNEMQQRQPAPVIDEQTMSLLALTGVCEGGPVDLADRHNELVGLGLKKLI